MEEVYLIAPLQKFCTREHRRRRAPANLVPLNEVVSKMLTALIKGTDKRGQ